MKKKFLTLALVLMVAVTLSAATPIEVRGSLTAVISSPSAVPRLELLGIITAKLPSSHPSPAIIGKYQSVEIFSMVLIRGLLVLLLKFISTRP